MFGFILGDLEKITFLCMCFADVFSENKMYIWFCSVGMMLLLYLS